MCNCSYMYIDISVVTIFFFASRVKKYSKNTESGSSRFLAYHLMKGKTIILHYNNYVIYMETCIYSTYMYMYVHMYLYVYIPISTFIKVPTHIHVHVSTLVPT